LSALSICAYTRADHILVHQAIASKRVLCAAGTNTSAAGLFPLGERTLASYNDRMADLFTVTAPLLIRRADGRQHVVAEIFPHPEGVVYFELFWNLRDPPDGVHVVQGPFKGDGPWKVGDAVIRVLGCHGTDGALARQFDEWRQYRSEHADAYPERAFIESIARRHGALI
jgi:hypothetical protein